MCASELQKCLPEEQNVCIRYKSMQPKNKMSASELQKCSSEEQNVCIRPNKSLNPTFDKCTSNLQGVPRNMTIARRLESRLRYLNLFVTFSLLSTLICMILETIIT